MHFASSIKKVKFMAIKFRGLTNILRFFKDAAKVSSLSLLSITTKATHFLLTKKKIPILWIELRTNKMQKVSKPFI